MRRRQFLAVLTVVVISLALSAADECVDHVPTCSLSPDLCANLTYAETQCPKFCNFCIPATAKSSIGTTPKPGGTTQTTQRPITIKPTCSGSCKDTIDNCRDYLDLCKNPSYASMMSEKCACSCHFCSSNACEDANPHCADWAQNGFCTSTDYSQATKKAYCAKTCKLC